MYDLYNTWDWIGDGRFIVLWRTPAQTGWVSCLGDSGGPLVQFDREGRAVQVGVFRGSMGPQDICQLLCDVKVPTQKDIEKFDLSVVFTRVAFYMDWMEEQITGRKREEL